MTECDIDRHTFMRAAIASLLVAVSVSAADLPRYWSVHIDVPADQAQFETLDAAYYKHISTYYTSHQLAAPPVVVFSLADGTHFGMRPRASLSDFEKPSALTDEQRKELSTRTGPISDATHAVLHMHHSEIWEVDRELTNVTSTRAPKYMILRTDYVRPPYRGAYDQKMKALIDELKDVRVLAFVSVYGDGAIRYLFMSDQPFKVGPLAEAKTVDVAARARPDLTGDADHWLRY